MHPLDDERPSPEERKPPQLMVVLRQQIVDLGAGRKDVIVEDEFRAEGVYRAGDGPGWAVYGWGTTISPVRNGLPISVWFDGFDRDLTVHVDGRFRFEWRELSDEAAVLSSVIGLCAGVLRGDAWEWRSRRSRGLEVMAPGGRLMTATDGRRYGLPWWGSQRVISRRRLPAYSLDPDTAPSSE